MVNLSCSFCGKNQREVKTLIAGPGCYICDQCIGLCNEILGDELLRDRPSDAAPESASGAEARVSSWLRPCLERLGGTVDALQALRPALEGLVPGLRLKVLDDGVGQISEVRGLLVTAAANESVGKPRSVD